MTSEIEKFRVPTQPDHSTAKIHRETLITYCVLGMLVSTVAFSVWAGVRGVSHRLTDIAHRLDGAGQ